MSSADDAKNKKFKVKLLSLVQLFATPWTVVCQAPLSVGFPRQEYWSGLPFLSPRDLPDPGIEPWYPSLQSGCLTSEPPGKSDVKNKSKLFSREVVIIQARMVSDLNHRIVMRSWILDELFKVQMMGFVRTGEGVLEPGRGAERPATESAGRLGMFILKLLWAEEPGRLQSTGSQESDTTKQLNHHHESQEKI